MALSTGSCFDGLFLVPILSSEGYGFSASLGPLRVGLRGFPLLHSSIRSLDSGASGISASRTKEVCSTVSSSSVLLVLTAFSLVLKPSDVEIYMHDVVTSACELH